MALQGTLDTFALPDVLRLLASTKKTGRLVIIGARGNGSVWVDDGSVVGTDASGATHDADAVEILFELLRFGGEGSFTFEAGTKADRPTPARAVEPLLIDAERQLAEWREVEAVVPSMDAWVSLVSDVAADEVTIAADADLTKTMTVVGETRHMTAGAELWLWTRSVGIRGGLSKDTVVDRGSASVGLSLALRSGIYLEGQLTGGSDATRPSWGSGLRVTF